MTRDEIDRLAGEYVLGLLDGEDAASAERLLERDPAFEAAVAHWRARFSELDDAAPTLPASDALWQRIEAGIEADETAAETARPPAPPALAPSRRLAFAALWRSLPFWRASGLVGAAAPVALAVALARSPGPPPVRAPAFVAVLMTDDNRPAAVVNAFADGHAELIPLQGVTVPQGRSLEVWTFARGTNAPPVSIGVLSQARTIRLRLEDLPRLRADQLFAISLEPPGGSPTGQPTGPVLMKGAASTAL
jgi:anti-sigma-K factor RskA